MSQLSLVKAIIRCLVLSSSEELTTVKLDRAYKLAEGEPIPYKRFGYYNLLSFLHSLKDVVKLRNADEEFTVHYVQEEKTCNIYNMIEEMNSENLLPYSISVEQLQNERKVLSIESKKDFKTEQYNNLIKNQQTNISNAEEDTFYLESGFSRRQLGLCNLEQQKKQNINHQTSHYRDLISDNDTRGTEKNLHDEYKDSDKKETNSKHLHECDLEDFVDPPNDYDEEAVPEFAVNNLIYMLDFPDNTVLFGTEIKQYEIPKGVKVGSVIPIFIAEVYNPFKFWFHIMKEEHPLDLLMFEMEIFYKQLTKDDYSLPLKCIIPGQICSVYVYGGWHRAEILTPLIDGKAKVICVDYGSVTFANVDQIKCLDSRFVSLPKQAMRGSLSHIQPDEQHWTHSDSNFFLSIVSESLVYGKVTEIDKENLTFYMVMCKSKGGKVIHINEEMVKESHARFDKEWLCKDGNRKHHAREDFPTFSMIEKGEYPSLKELVEMENLNIQYEYITDRKLYHPGRLNDHKFAPQLIKNLPFPLLNSNPFRCEILLQD